MAKIPSSGSFSASDVIAEWDMSTPITHTEMMNICGFDITTSSSLRGKERYGIVHEFTLSSTDSTSYAYYGGRRPAISADSNVVCITETGNNKVHMLVRTGDVWNVVQTISYASNNNFGHAGVFLNEDGSLLFVTAWSGQSPQSNSVTNEGVVEVYSRSGNTWNPLTTIYANDSNQAHNFSYGFGMSRDASVLCISAPSDDENGSNTGAAYIFERSGNTWIQRDKLMPADASDTFNYGIGGSAVSDDGNIVCVSAYRDNDNGSDSGAAYVYQRSGNLWNQIFKIKPSLGGSSDYFSRDAIAMTSDGGYIAIGAYGDDDVGTNSGAVYVFKRSGNTWIEVDKLYADVIDGNEWLARSGVAISSDGGLIYATCSGDSTHGSDSGALYVYKKDGGNDSWVVYKKITVPTDASSTFTTSGLDISDTGVIVTGTPNTDNYSTNDGTAYIIQ